MFDALQQAMGVSRGAAPQIQTVRDVAMIAANVFIIIAFGISVASLAVNFIQFTTSAGDVKAVEKAQRGLLWSGIGLGVSLLAWILKSVFFSAAGIVGI